MKLHRTSERELYYYFLKNGEKRYMYRHKYYDMTGKRREKKKSGFRRKNDALRSLLELKAALLDGNVGPIENSKINVSKWMDIWYENVKKTLSPTTVEKYKVVIDNYIKPLIGSHSLNNLERETYIRNFINPMLETLKSSTVQIHHTIFNIAINSAVESEIISRNRFKNIKFERMEKMENFLKPDELNVFLNAAKKCLNLTEYTLILILAYTGIRRGELLGLKWSDIDFENNKIKINRTRDYYGSRKPKTYNSYRTILVDNDIIKQLKSYKKWCKATKFKFGEKLDKENDYAFITKNNKICSTYTISATFLRIYNYLDKKEIKINKITPHGLRHTHATILIMNKIPPKTIAERLGNTVEMIYKVYTHTFEELELKAMTTFSAALNNGAKTGAK